MKNYQILENRPELTKEQLTQGMDFNKIKMNAAITKKAILKSLIIKGALGVAIISSGVFVYKLTISSVSKSNPIVLIDSTKNLTAVANDSIVKIDEKNNETIVALKNEDKKNLIIPNSISGSSIDTSKEIATTNKMNNPIIVDQETVKIESKQTNNSITPKQEIPVSRISNQKRSKTAIVKSCKIWDSKDFCKIPKEAKFADSFDCNAVEFDYIDCLTANEIDNITGVWLTITTNGKETFQIENQLKNITLIKPNNNTQYPLMIKVGGENNFWGAKFKAKKILVHYNKQIDIFLFFKDATIGDKIIINNLIEALIEK